MNKEWKAKTGQFQSGQSLYLNRICVGSYGWNSSRSKGTTNLVYAGNISLPSLRNNRVYGETEEEIKTKIERAVDGWFNEALKPG